MPQVSGITFEKDGQGHNRFVRIDLDIYRNEIEPFLKKINAIDDESFENEWAQSLSSEEFKEQMHVRMQKWIEK